MPFVGMRRSTRVFVPKSVLKGGGGGGGDDEQARVLRPGKRLWSFSSDVKPRKGSEDEWFPMGGGDADDVPLCKSNGWRKIIQKRNLVVKRFRRKTEVLPEEKLNGSLEDKMFGNGYSRKRTASRTTASSVFEDRAAMEEDQMYVIQYVRKQRRRKTVEVGLFLPELSSSSVGISDADDDDDECGVLAGKCSSDWGENEESLSSVHRAKFEVFVRPCHDSARLFSSFLASLVNFMRRSSVRLSQLQAFMCSKPIASVFSQRGGDSSDSRRRLMRDDSDS